MARATKQATLAYAITLLAMLALVVWVARGGLQPLATAWLTLDAPASEQDAQAALDNMQNSTPLERVEITLHWIERGSTTAAKHLEKTLNGWQPGTLTGSARNTLEARLRRSPDPHLRRAAAAVLWQDGDPHGAEPGSPRKRALSVVLGKKANRRTDPPGKPTPAHLTWLSVYGPEVLPILLRHLEMAAARAAIVDLCSAYPEAQREAINGLVLALEQGVTVTDVLKTVTDRDFERTADWRRWWDKTRQRLERLER